MESGLLQIIGNKEVDDDYIAQVKTLSIHPDIVRGGRQEPEDRLHAPSRQRQRTRAPHPATRSASPM